MAFLVGVFFVAIEGKGPNVKTILPLHGLRYQQPKRKNSTLWKYFAISDMLTNEIYIGNMVQGKYGSVSYKTKQNKPRPQSECPCPDMPPPVGSARQ